MLANATKWEGTTQKQTKWNEWCALRFAKQEAGIAQVINDLSNPLQTDFKSLASANFATPAAGPQWRDSSIGV